MAIKQRTAHGNQIRGLLAEYGVVVAKGLSHLDKLPEILDKHQNKVSLVSRGGFLQLYEQLKIYSEQVEHYNKKIKGHAASDPRCVAVQEIEGVGPITASAIVATIMSFGFTISNASMGCITKNSVW